MAKTLIAYFSRADENYFGGAMRYVKVGNTEIVCTILKDLVDADLFKIEMKNPYSPVYMTCIEEAKRDLRAKARPALVSLPASLDGYDTIILAYPNYWGTMPMAVFSFLERFDFTGTRAAALAQVSATSAAPAPAPRSRPACPSPAAPRRAAKAASDAGSAPTVFCKGAAHGIRKGLCLSADGPGRPHRHPRELLPRSCRPPAASSLRTARWPPARWSRRTCRPTRWQAAFPPG